LEVKKWLTKFPMNASAAAPALPNAPFPRSLKATESTTLTRIPAWNAVPALPPAPSALPNRPDLINAKKMVQPDGCTVFYIIFKKKQGFGRSVAFKKLFSFAFGKY
jgi:hypothetical protein